MGSLTDVGHHSAQLAVLEELMLSRRRDRCPQQRQHAAGLHGSPVMVALYEAIDVVCGENFTVRDATRFYCSNEMSDRVMALEGTPSGKWC